MVRDVTGIHKGSMRPLYPKTGAVAPGSRGRWRSGTHRLFLLLLLVFLFIVYAAQYLELVRAKRQLVAVNKEIRLWEQKCKKMQDEIAYLKSPEYVEKIARERLGLVYPGETPFVIARPSDPDAPGRVKERKDRSRIIIGD
ncbi:MAG TPA: septum formation initiator family protein [Firmicutes bacterium]|nr:septum formation initiator family protein [Bacillota bacterium]